MGKPDLQEVLAEVNRLRAERDLSPLSEMPKGASLSALTDDDGLLVCECPVAKAIEGVATYRWLAPTLEEADAYSRLHDMDPMKGQFPEGIIRTPHTLSEFMRAHDRNAYPELIA